MKLISWRLLRMVLSIQIRHWPSETLYTSHKTFKIINSSCNTKSRQLWERWNIILAVTTNKIIKQQIWCLFHNRFTFESIAYKINRKILQETWTRDSHQRLFYSNLIKIPSTELITTCKFQSGSSILITWIDNFKILKSKKKLRQQNL